MLKKQTLLLFLFALFSASRTFHSLLRPLRFPFVFSRAILVYRAESLRQFPSTARSSKRYRCPGRLLPHFERRYSILVHFRGLLTARNTLQCGNWLNNSFLKAPRTF